VNFVGKILGQGGENVKRLQEMAGCRIAVLGRGSMKDKNKVEILCALVGLVSRNLVHHSLYSRECFHYPSLVEEMNTVFLCHHLIQCWHLDSRCLNKKFLNCF